MRFAGKACQPCKDSRKKCDEARPTCKRCMKSGRTCHGYRPSFDVIQAENMYASGQVKRPRGARTRAKQLPDFDPTPSRNISSEAVAYYMHNYLLPADKSDPVLSTWSSSPALENALLSAALAIFSRVKKCQSLAATESHARYQTSILALQNALINVQPSNVDANLLSILFMTRYEDSLFGETPAFTPRVFRERYVRVHHAGLCALLEYWIKNTVQSDEIASTLSIKHARRKLRKAAMLADFELPVSLRDGMLFGETGSDLDLDHLLIRIIDLRKQVSPLLTHAVSPAFLQEAADIHQEADSIDKALCLWSSSSLAYSSDHAKLIAKIQCFGYQILVRHMQIQTLERMSTLLVVPTLTEFIASREAIQSTAKALSSATAEFLDLEVSISNKSDSLSINNGSLLLEGMMPQKIEQIVLSLIIAASTPYIDKIYADGFRSQLVQAGRACGCGLMEALAHKSLLNL